MKNFAVVLSASLREEGTEIIVQALSELSCSYRPFVPDDLKSLNDKEFDGLIFPGDAGTITVLVKLPEVPGIIKAFYDESKPILAVGTSSILIATTLRGATITIGNEGYLVRKVKELGANFEDCALTDFVTDREFKVITTPGHNSQGINGAVRELVEMS